MQYVSSTRIPSNCRLYSIAWQCVALILRSITAGIQAQDSLRLTVNQPSLHGLDPLLDQ
jgi:hypothetical protein